MDSTEYRYPCDNCGASLRFAPGESVLICPYCGHRQAITDADELPADEAAPVEETSPAGRRLPRIGSTPESRPARDALQWDTEHKAPGLQEIPLGKGLSLDQSGDLTVAARMLSCPNCGAKLAADAAHQASRCPFCATPVVTDTGPSRMIKVQAVLPFVITEAEARASLEKWFKGLWFAPNGLAQYARRGRKMRGIYSPFWTFDADTESRYTGARGDYYYETVWVTRTVNGRTQRVAEQQRRVRWTSVSGRVARNFDDVLVLASSALPRHITDALAPWELAALHDYRPAYLAGFEAEGYSIDLASGHERARNEMARVIASDVRRDIGGDVQRVNGISTDHRAETFKHILLPIWSAAYKYNGKSYRFVVNGQSGRVQGERPWSIWKIALAVLAILIALLAFVLLSDGLEIQLGQNIAPTGSAEITLSAGLDPGQIRPAPLADTGLYQT